MPRSSRPFLSALYSWAERLFTSSNAESLASRASNNWASSDSALCRRGSFTCRIVHAEVFAFSATSIGRSVPASRAILLSRIDRVWSLAGKYIAGLGPGAACSSGSWRSSDGRGSIKSSNGPCTVAEAAGACQSAPQLRLCQAAPTIRPTGVTGSRRPVALSVCDVPSCARRCTSGTRRRKLRRFSESICVLNCMRIARGARRALIIPQAFEAIEPTH